MSIERVGSPRRPCIFPFEYKDVWDDTAPWIRYDKCTTDYDGIAFCPTDFSRLGTIDKLEIDRFKFWFHEVPSGKERSDFWGHCSPDCPVAPGPGGE